MKIGFDLDGTLDKPALRALALALLSAGHEVHVISGAFPESGEWQDEQAKLEKLVRFGLAQPGPEPGKFKLPERLFIEVVNAVELDVYDREGRLVDIGLRKGAYIEKNGIELMFDDSKLYCKMMPAMCGAQIVQVL